MLSLFIVQLISNSTCMHRSANLYQQGGLRLTLTSTRRKLFQTQSSLYSSCALFTSTHIINNAVSTPQHQENRKGQVQYAVAS